MVETCNQVENTKQQLHNALLLFMNFHTKIHHLLLLGHGSHPRTVMHIRSLNVSTFSAYESTKAVNSLTMASSFLFCKHFGLVLNATFLFLLLLPIQSFQNWTVLHAEAPDILNFLPWAHYICHLLHLQHHIMRCKMWNNVLKKFKHFQCL